MQRLERQATHGRALIRSAALIASSFAVVSVAFTVSCNRTPPTGPSQPPFITRLDLIAPRSLAPGATVQLRLIAHQSDGSTQDITATASFSSQSRDVIDISPTGVATAVKLGESFVSARAQNGTANVTSEIVVVPDGTFRVLGQVVEDDVSRVPIGDVRVEAESVPIALTDIDGRYRLYGVPGNGRLRFSKTGYITREVTLAISDHHIENVALTTASPRLDVSGQFQLSIEAPECRGQIPDALLSRRYDAAITQSHGEIRGVLSGANFAPGRFGGLTNVFSGLVEPSQVVLRFYYYGTYYENASLIEIVYGTTQFVVHGEARLTPVGPNYQGTMEGYLLVFPGNAFYSGPPDAVCTAKSLRVALTR
ncbi:MAG TPA: hypothetical protein VHI99_17770 [Vicinamibacterales bacterium]|nr:hypothetical protein [Vicinamibacterales bacterium]